jgi:uncharacterized damage-inducible protein DinB
METGLQLANRFREVMLNGKWIANTNWKEQLSDVEWEMAVKPLLTFNTVAELTFHLNYYVSGLNDFFEFGNLSISDKFSFDCPPILSETDWDELRNTLLKSCYKFAIYIDSLSLEKLGSIFVNEKYGSYRRNIEGVIEHAYYHLGQVVLIKKGLQC